MYTFIVVFTVRWHAQYVDAVAIYGKPSMDSRCKTNTSMRRLVDEKQPGFPSWS